jgi:hypothetical protein
MSRIPPRSRKARAVLMTSAGSRPVSSAAGLMRQGLAVAGQEGGQDQVAVAVVAGGCGFGGPDRVEDAEMVGVGQAALPDGGCGQFGAVAAEDVGEDGDRLAWVRSAGAGRRGFGWEVSGALLADALVAAEFGSCADTGLRVGGSRWGGEDEGQVGVGASSHRRVQPLPVLSAGDQGDAGVHGGALG